MSKVVFKSSNNEFYQTLSREVYQYFADKSISPTGNFSLYLKTLIFALLYVYLYVQLVFFTPSSIILCIGLCILAGCNFAFIGFNVMHDACHGSFSSNRNINKIFAYSLNALGSNVFFWNTKHNIVHHTFTNIDGIDSDIIQNGLLRLAPSQKKLWVHRFQHIYCLFLYAFSYLSWIYINDFEKYFTKKVEQTEIKGFTLKEHVIFWVSKLSYLFFFIVLPIIKVGFLPTLIGYLILSAATGILIAIVFQLAHVVEITEFEDATKEDLTVEHAWAVHQFNTTANFATQNRLVSWFVGGLNFQVEHHLFPKISHVHYNKIQHIVRDVCKRYGVEYRSFKTTRSAIISHFRQMRNLGKFQYAS